MKREITAPVHTAALGIGNVRFFRSPLDGPRFAWHSIEDLHRSIAMDRSLRRHMLRCLSQTYGGDIRTILTDAGETMIGPHFMGQGLIGSMIEMGVAPAGLALAYAKAMADAMTALTASMGPAESVNYSIAAFRLENGIAGDFEPLRFHPDGKGGGIVR